MRRLVFCAWLCAVAACGSEKAEETAFDPMTEQIDRIQRQVDTLPQERKDRLDQAIEAEE